MYKCRIVFTYVDFDGCDKQFIEHEKEFPSLSAASAWTGMKLNAIRKSDIALYPYDSTTAMLYSFEAVYNYGIRKEQGS